MTARSPGIKLLFVGGVALVLIIPLLVIYALVGDRESQSRIAEESISAGWGGPQIISGPVLAIPYMREDTQTEQAEGRSVTRTRLVRDELFLTPQAQEVRTQLAPESRARSIYRSVVYLAGMEGKARFSLPDELSRSGVERQQMMFDQAELRFGVSDPRGLQRDARVTIDGKAVPLQPGKGTAMSGGSGFHGLLDWSGDGTLDVDWQYSLRGSRSLALVPLGGETRWQATSTWQHPSFGGSFLPDNSDVGSDGFAAHYSVTNLALGQALVLLREPAMPTDLNPFSNYFMDQAGSRSEVGAPAMSASIGLIEPVDLYSRVNRSVKYGFLFIGFTFLAFFMFDVVGGARVAAAEYFLTGAGLALFFVLLLAFAEIIGFSLAYMLASAAIILLLSAYSAAVLRSRKRAKFIFALLIGLYALIYVLLNLEALSLMIGSILLFVSLAGVMYATRNVEWGNVEWGNADKRRAAKSTGKG